LRQFSIVFGTSELAVATVLAAYMGGLAAGAAVIARVQHRIERPVLAYGVLEGGIAISALAVPALIAAASGLYVAVLGGQPEPPDAAGIGQSLFYLAVAFLVLAIPTGLMGATLPLLTRYAVRSNQEVGPRLAVLYAVNTAGAVAGTLAAAFVLLPAIGLRATVWCGVAVNALVFLIARHCARQVRDEPEMPVEHAAGFASLRGRILRQPAWILPLMLVSGAIAFAYEVLWTRLLTHVVGGSVYAFAIMLAAFLSGIAIGGGLAGRMARRREHAALWFAAAQAGIAVLAALVYAWIGSLIPEQRNLGAFALYSIVVMLPATVFIGATFPLAVRLLAADERQAADATARVYAWNTVGAIAGSVLTGFWLLPRLGFEGLMALAVLANLALALWTLVFTTRFRRLAVGATIAVTAVFVVWHDPVRPNAVIGHSTFSIASAGTPEEVFYRVGRSATVLVEASGGQLSLRTNGLPEASIGVDGALPIGHVDRWLTGLPIAARPRAQSLLLVGLGGAIAIETVPASIAEVDVVELEPAVIAANEAIAPYRAVDPLADSRVRLIVNDARNALRLTDKRYDIVVSQPSHPWTAGASHLYTREFAALAKRHLKPDGVFLQWVGAGFVTEPLLRSVVASLLDTFAAVRLYQAGGSALLLLASDGSLDIERSLLATGEPLRGNVLTFSYMGLNGADDFAAALVMDEVAARAYGLNSEPITDDFNRMATQSRALADGSSAVDLIDTLAQHDSMLDMDSAIHRDLGAQIDFINVARRWIHDGFTRRAARLAAVVPDPSDRAFIEGLVHGARGELDAAYRAYAAALDAAPQSATIRYALLEPRLAEIAGDRATAATRELAAGLSGSAEAVVRGWRLAAMRNWAELARLDGALAAANPTDIWYAEAVQLRADWRVQADDERYAGDAVRMIDRALMIRPKLELLLLRAAATDILGDNAAFVETARNVASFVRTRLIPVLAQGAPARNATRRQLVALRAKLDSFGARVPRALEVADEMTGVIDAL
jgi:spermidine synthase